MIVLVRAQRVASARAEDPVDRAMVIAGVGKSALELRYFCVIDIVVGVTVTVAVVAVWIVAIRIITVIIRVVPVRVAPPTPERETEAIDEDDIFIMIVTMMMPIPVIPMLTVPVLAIPMLTNKMLAVPVLAIPRSDSVAASERSREPDSCRYRGEVVGARAMGPSAKCRCSESCRQEATQVRQGFRIHRVSGS